MSRNRSSVNKKRRLASKYSLTTQISGAIDLGEDDLVYSPNNLARDTRSEEVNNCWTYPTMNSFETSLISGGLVSSPTEFEGSEWHMSLHQTSGDTRRALDFKRETEIFDVGFGGFDYYGMLYFATGRDGAAVPESRQERYNISTLLAKAKDFHRRREPFPDPGQLSTIYPDPLRSRQFAYDSGITLKDDKDTKRFIQANNISAHVAFYVSESNAALGFFDYLYNPKTRRNISGDNIAEWLDPQDFSLRDKRGDVIGVEDFFAKALKDSIINSEDFSKLQDAFDRSNSPGRVSWNPDYFPAFRGAHAVTILGWDNNYISPITNHLERLLGYLSSDKIGLSSETVSSLNSWAVSEGFKYTNQGAASTGAWFVQNSWGKGELEFQYIPYSLVADQGKTFHLADKTGLFGRVESSAIRPGESLIGKSYYDEIGYKFKYNTGDSIAAIGVYIEEGDSESRIRAAIYNGDNIGGDPVATTGLVAPHTGYQTLRFDSPVSLSESSELVAVVSQDIKSGRKDLLDATKLDVGKVIQSSSSSYSPGELDFYRDLPLYYNNLIRTEGQSIASNVYYGKTGLGWQDLASLDETVFLNVVYASEENTLTNDSDLIIGSSSSDNIFVNDKGNVIKALGGNDTVYVFHARNRIRLGSGNNAVIATEASGKDLVISGGRGDDSYTFSLGKGNHFKGEATIGNFALGDTIRIDGFEERDLVSLERYDTVTMFEFEDFSLKIKGCRICSPFFSNGLIALR